MYESYWELSRLPFQNLPDPTFFCPLPASQRALEKLLYAVRSGRAGGVLTGEVGTGKSTLTRVFLLQLAAEQYEVGVVINPSIAADDLLYDIALQLGLSPETSSRAGLFRALNDLLLASAQQGKSTVLIIDEAHTIRDESVFSDLIMLLNVQLNDRQLLSLVLLGPPELTAMLARQASLDQRLATRASLGRLSEVETAYYIDFRLKKAGTAAAIFTPHAVTAIHRAAKGIPRVINNLCDACLLEGSKRRATGIDAGLVSEIIAST